MYYLLVSLKFLSLNYGHIHLSRDSNIASNFDTFSILPQVRWQT